jgi:hypothetical protein
LWEKGLAFWELEERKSNWWKECSIDYYSISIENVWVSSWLLDLFVCVHVYVENWWKIIFFSSSSSWWKNDTHTHHHEFMYTQIERSFRLRTMRTRCFSVKQQAEPTMRKKWREKNY